MDELYRLRVGDFRVIFEKNNMVFIIVVIDVGNRREIYK
jgi:mRNA interferase RelE/StbE